VIGETVVLLAADDAVPFEFVYVHASPRMCEREVVRSWRERGRRGGGAGGGGEDRAREEREERERERERMRVCERERERQRESERERERERQLKTPWEPGRLRKVPFAAGRSSLNLTLEPYIAMFFSICIHAKKKYFVYSCIKTNKYSMS
jgi:hypothetical protein